MELYEMYAVAELALYKSFSCFQKNRQKSQISLSFYHIV